MDININKLKKRQDLKHGKCTAILWNRSTGRYKKEQAKYNDKLNIVFCCHCECWDIIGYQQ